MIQAELFDVAALRVPTTRPCPQCGKRLSASAPQECGGAVNVDFWCVQHGWQFTESTSKEFSK